MHVRGSLPVANRQSPPVFPEQTIVERMAATMITLNAQPDGVTRQGLRQEGFSQADIDRHFEDASIETTTREVREVHSERYGDNRSARIERAANLAAGLVAFDAIASYLLANGYQPRELGDIMPDIITRMCQLVVSAANEPAKVQ